MDLGEKARGQNIVNLVKGAMLVLGRIKLEDNSRDHFQQLPNLHMIAKSCWVLVLVVNSATTEDTT